MSTKILPEAIIVPLKSISIIWLIPIIALFIGMWMIYFHLSSQGPLIIIYFESGESIEAGKTKIKVNNVDVGLVENIELNDNLKGIAVTARIQKHNINLLKSDTQFWVVRPKIGRGGISGLGTLLSGAYIALSPGNLNSEKFKFIGLESEPVTAAGTPGLHITLDSNNNMAFQVGDPIIYHGIKVGRIEYVHFNSQERIVYYNAFIENPFNKLITTNTRFWQLNGIEVDLSSDGIRIQSGTLETMITGGVTFDVPNDIARGEIVTEREYFTIYPNKDAIKENRFKYALHYILLFKNSIRGLKPGATVEYRGIKIGRVVRTDINYDEISNLLNQDTLIPVLISIEPARMGFKDNKKILPKVKKNIIKLIKNGLRGGLAMGSLLTGRKYIELQYEQSILNTITTYSGHVVIPTIESQFDQIIKKTGKIMDKFYKLPLKPVLTTVTNILTEFKSTTEQLNILLKESTDKKLVNSVKDALDNFNKLSTDYSEGSLTHNELLHNLNLMKNVLSELEPLLSQLNRKPNSLIFGDNMSKDSEPKGIKQ
jgi:paraquat-inducible protein B